MSPNSHSSHQPAAHRPAFELPAQPMSTVAVVLVIAGIIGFGTALSYGLSARAWEAYLVNLLFWMGVAQGGVVASAAFYLTQGRWAGRAHYRLAEAFSGFLVLGFILFWALYFGRDAIFPWIKHPVPAKEGWLNVPFLFARDGIALFVMTVLSLWFVAASRSDEARKWAETSGNIYMPPKAVRRLAPAVAICFALVYTLLSFDLVMSLSPLWHSTLFGWWFFAGTFWSAIVTMSLSAVWLRRVLPAGNAFTNKRVLHDFGKMVFAFSIFWVYTLFAQYIVIWYGDIPIETFFVVLRTQYLPWAFVSWLTLTLVWIIPFFVLLGQRPKRTPRILGTVALLGMIGIWCEIYVLVVPSLSPRTVPFGWVEILVTAGFAGAFWLCSYPGLKLASVAAAEPIGELH
ncbi:MAG TPA: hypothetical protein VFB33_11000 [Candidatus Binataceae bacterium]|jgi:hypothetical protein|nr:hypothetical protein [Candidatus Binataceae bacterium]